jgi:hypothetical protein
MTTESEPVRIHIPALDDEGMPENMWATKHPTRPNVYQIDNVPFISFDIAFRDWVECDPEIDDESLPTFKRIYRPSGYGTAEARMRKKTFRYKQAWNAFCDAVIAKPQWASEGTFPGMRVIAVPPGQEQDAQALFDAHPLVEVNWLLSPLLSDPASAIPEVILDAYTLVNKTAWAINDETWALIGKKLHAAIGEALAAQKDRS